jgi:glycosyltransferase involved in cell wall biosynthesis
MIEAYITATAGAVLLISRHLSRSLDEIKALSPWPKVSIIIPARNEAENLPNLLRSLERLDYPSYEVILIDDQSTDDTFDIGSRYAKVKALNGAPRPEEWTGKTWACHQGALAASGDILLFTDADTIHRIDSLKRAVSTLRIRDAGLLSCLPFHSGSTWWEQLLGPFHIILLAMTSPYGEPKPRRLFAIGQYLLFDAAIYRTIGGHAAIKKELVDDLALARVTIESGARYHVFRGDPLFDVRMYANLSEFIAGWRRNFRLGFSYSHPLSGIEATLMIMALVGAGHWGTSWYTTLVSLLCLLFIGWRQPSLGHFSRLGVILWPFSLFLFCLTAGLSLFDLVFKRQLKWKGRQYTHTSKGARAVTPSRCQPVQ